MGKKRLPGALVILITFVIQFSDIFAQQPPKKTISGIITDQTNVFLANAKKINATTYVNNAFKMNVPSDAKTLLVSYVGSEPKEVAIEEKTTSFSQIGFRIHNPNNLDETFYPDDVMLVK